MQAFLQQRSARFTKWWVIANLIALPLFSFAIFFDLAFASWGMSFTRFRWQLWVELLPGVILAAGICGLVIGLVQGSALRIKGIKVFGWTLATATGVAGGVTLLYVAWHLFPLAESISEQWNMPLPSRPLAYIVSILLVVFHGCPMAFLQWRVLRFECYFTLASWPWGAGLTWSLLTPTLFIIIDHGWEGIAAWILDAMFPFLFLLLPLPYIVLTTLLWKRRGV